MSDEPQRAASPLHQVELLLAVMIATSSGTVALAKERPASAIGAALAVAALVGLGVRGPGGSDARTGGRVFHGCAWLRSS